jgi:hypothetical protein
VPRWLSRRGERASARRRRRLLAQANKPQRARLLYPFCASEFGVTLFFWYFFNAVFAIFNKKTLNVFPYPWLLSWIQARRLAEATAAAPAAPDASRAQLACGSVFMCLVWALRIYPAPKARPPYTLGTACACAHARRGR